jgi:hypothetical protein
MPRKTHAYVPRDTHKHLRHAVTSTNPGTVTVVLVSLQYIQLYHRFILLARTTGVVADLACFTARRERYVHHSAAFIFTNGVNTSKVTNNVRRARLIMVTSSHHTVITACLSNLTSTQTTAVSETLVVNHGLPIPTSAAGALQ